MKPETPSDHTAAESGADDTAASYNSLLTLLLNGIAQPRSQDDYAELQAVP